jgi:hypothetical protein
MSACPNCGAIPKPNDRFCNTCGTPVRPQQGQPAAAYGAPAPPPAVPPQGYGQAPAPPPPWGAQPALPSRCQQGHEIAAGQNYCSQGHPIALEGVQFAGNPQPYVVDPRAQQGSGAYGGQSEYAATALPAPAYPGHPGSQGGAPQAPYAFAPPQQAYAPAQYTPPPQAPQPAYAPSPLAPPPAYAPPAPAAYAPPAQAAYAPSPQPQAAPAFKPSSQPAGDVSNDATPHGRVLRGFLVSFQNSPQGDFWPLFSGRLTIGRSNSGEVLDLPLADATISSRHAALTLDIAGPIHVEDTGSTNGTFVNDEHLGFNGRRELHDGDRVRFGGYAATIKILARS